MAEAEEIVRKLLEEARARRTGIAQTQGTGGAPSDQITVDRAVEQVKKIMEEASARWRGSDKIQAGDGVARDQIAKDGAQTAVEGVAGGRADQAGRLPVNYQQGILDFAERAAEEGILIADLNARGIRTAAVGGGPPKEGVLGGKLVGKVPETMTREELLDLQLEQMMAMGPEAIERAQARLGRYTQGGSTGSFAELLDPELVKKFREHCRAKWAAETANANHHRVSEELEKVEVKGGGPTFVVPGSEDRHREPQQADGQREASGKSHEDSGARP